MVLIASPLISTLERGNAVWAGDAGGGLAAAEGRRGRGVIISKDLRMKFPEAAKRSPVGELGADLLLRWTKTCSTGM